MFLLGKRCLSAGLLLCVILLQTLWCLSSLASFKKTVFNEFDPGDFASCV